MIHTVVNEGQIVLYQPDESISLEVKLEQETVWLTQPQMVQLFNSSKGNISEHITNIYEQGELTKDSTVRKFRTVRKEGNRMVARNLDYYNLDMIISVGFRVNSQQGIRFRQWANQVLREYLLRGYSINRQLVAMQERTDNRFLQLEQRLDHQPTRQRIHDRFLIIDDEVYHLGASLNELGKRLFAFSRMQMGKEVIMSQVR